jgi:NAD(P)-dependent dehydrogenase (short-subunit alcohol dehydrogenase family)
LTGARRPSSGSRRITAADGTAEFRPLDISDNDRFEECLLAVAETCGGMDALFSNAGIGEARSVQA